REVCIADAPEEFRVLVDPVRDVIEPFALIYDQRQLRGRVGNEAYPLELDRMARRVSERVGRDILVTAAFEKHLCSLKWKQASNCSPSVARPHQARQYFLLRLISDVSAETDRVFLQLHVGEHAHAEFDFRSDRIERGIESLFSNRETLETH